MEEKSGIAGMGWLAAGGFLVLAALAALYFTFRGGNAVPGAAIVAESARDVFQSQGKGQIYEIDLDDAAHRTGAGTASEAKNIMPSGAEKSGSEIKIAQTLSAGKTRASKSSATSSPAISKPSAASGASSAPSVPPKICDFGTGANPSRALAFNEIAWMGTSRSPDNEWIEIKNNGSEPYNAERVQLLSESGKIKIIFGSGTIPAHGFYLLERTDEDTVPGISADMIYTGGLSNGGERLKLFDANCGLLDEVNALSGWGTFGGNNGTKHTAERNLKDLAWHTSADADGTPRAENSKEPDPPPQNSAPPTPTVPSGPTGGGGQPPAQNPPASPPPANSSSTPIPPPPAQPSSTPPVQQSAVPVISEILAGIDSNADYEFVELYNPTDAAIDLTGWELRKRTATSTLSGTESNLVDNNAFSGSIPARGYFLIASPGYQGASVPDLVYSAVSASIAYKGNMLLLYNGDHASATVVGQVSWVEIPKGQSYERDLATGTFSVQAIPNPRNSQGGN